MMPRLFAHHNSPDIQRKLRIGSASYHLTLQIVIAL